MSGKLRYDTRVRSETRRQESRSLRRKQKYLENEEALDVGFDFQYGQGPREPNWMLSGRYGDDVRKMNRIGTSKQSREDLVHGKTTNVEDQVDLERVSQRLMLERNDLDAKTAQVRREFAKLARRKVVLEEEWKKLHAERAQLEEDKKRFYTARKSPWFQSNLIPTSDLRRVRINVGGQLFETCEKVLKRDPGSLLAALVQPDSPLKPDGNGCYIIDRDWFLFRHVLAFLRDGVLPQADDTSEDQLIGSLYKEAEYYNLESLRCAIREYLDPYQLVEKSAAVPLSRLHVLEATLNRSLKIDDQVRDGEHFTNDGFEELEKLTSKTASKKASDSKKKASDEFSWWTGSKYNGKDFSLKPLIDEERGRSNTQSTTWSRKGGADSYKSPLHDDEDLYRFGLGSTWAR